MIGTLTAMASTSDAGSFMEKSRIQSLFSGPNCPVRRESIGKNFLKNIKVFKNLQKAIEVNSLSPSQGFESNSRLCREILKNFQKSDSYPTLRKIFNKQTQ